MLLRGELRKYTQKLNFENFESALYSTSVSMPLKKVDIICIWEQQQHNSGFKGSTKSGQGNQNTDWWRSGSSVHDNWLSGMNIESSLVYPNWLCWWHLSKSNCISIHDCHSLVPDKCIHFKHLQFKQFWMLSSWWHFLYCCCCCMDSCWCCTYFWIGIVKALSVRWCKSTLSRFSEFTMCLWRDLHLKIHSVLVDT